MSTGHSRSDDHPERSAESDDWVKAARDVRAAYRELYAALGGNDEEGGVDVDRFGYGERTSSK